MRLNLNGPRTNASADGRFSEPEIANQRDVKEAAADPHGQRTVVGVCKGGVRASPPSLHVEMPHCILMLLLQTPFVYGSLGVEIPA